MFKYASQLNKVAARRTFIRLSVSQVERIARKLKLEYPLLPVSIIPNFDNTSPVNFGTFSIKTERRLTREQLEQLTTFLESLNLDVKAVGGIRSPRIQLTALSEGIENISALRSDSVIPDSEDTTVPTIFRLSSDEVGEIRKEIRQIAGIGIGVRYVTSPVTLKGSFTIDWSKLDEPLIEEVKKWLADNEYLTIAGHPENFFASKNMSQLINSSSEQMGDLESESDPQEIRPIEVVDNIMSLSSPVKIQKSEGLEEETSINNNLARSISYESFIDGFNFITILFLTSLLDTPETKNVLASGLIIANKHTRLIKASFLNLLSPIASGNPELETLLNPLNDLDFDKADWKKVIINIKKIVDSLASSNEDIFIGLFPLNLQEDVRNLLRIFSEKKGTKKGLIGALSVIPNYRTLLGTSEWIDTMCSRLGIERNIVDRISSDSIATARISKRVCELEKHLTVADDVAKEAISVSLRLEKKKLEELLNSTNNFEGVVASISNQAVKNRETNILTKIGFSDEQTQVILSKGSNIVAAGAGSGKTRAMAGTVAYQIDSGSARPEEIIANSFTRKSSQELRERCERFLGIGEGGLKGDNLYIGRTIDSTVASLILKYGREQYVGRMFFFTDKNDLFTSLLRAAICQVSMFQTDTSLDAIFIQIIRALIESDSDVGFRFKDTLDNYTRTGKLEITNTLLKVLKNRVLKAYNGDIKSISSSLSGISPRDLTRLEMFIGLTDFNFSESKEGTSYFKDGFGVKTEDEKELTKQASKTEREEQETKRNYVATEMKRTPYLYTPANKWFNIGYPYKITVKDAASAVARLSGKFRNPEELWNKYKDFYKFYSDPANNPEMDMETPPEPPCMLAVWGAYEWIKRNEPSIKKVLGDQYPLDRTDTLWAFGDLIQSNSNARAKIQSRFKVVLIDEGQDLNAAQHRFYEYIAGIRNPATDNPWETKDNYRPARGLTADIYSIIGDDKQCVSSTTCILTENGYKLAGEMKEGDTVLSYRNGALEEQKVRHVQETGWTWGYRIETDTGKILIMSPNHRIWVNTPSSNRSYKNYVNILAHTDKGTVVKYQNLMVNFSNYREALEYATTFNQHIIEKILFQHNLYELVSATSLKEEMFVLSLDSSTLAIYSDKIIKVERVDDSFIDLDIEDASNFFGNDILSHNSIYSFRSADPEELVHRSNLQGGNYNTILLSTNYRSGEAIVDSANTLISHNSAYQIPMTCQATPKKGSGFIASKGFDTYTDLCEYVMKEIRTLKDERPDLKWKDFGIVVRVNDETCAFELAALKNQIPYVKARSMMSDPVLMKLINWLTLAVTEEPSKLEEMFYATLSFPETGLSADNLRKKIITGVQSDKRLLSTYESTGILDFIISQFMILYSKKSMESILISHAKMCKDIREKASDPTISFDSLIDYMLNYSNDLSSRKSLREAFRELDREMKSSIDDDEASSEELEDEASEDKKEELPVILSVKKMLSMSQKDKDVKEFGLTDIKSVVDYFSKLKRIAENNKKKMESEKEDAMQILTVHLWKGLEARYVFVVMNDTTFPDARRLFTFGPKNNKKAVLDHPRSENIFKYNRKVREDRRMAYVALTRGEESVLTVWSRKDHKNKDSGPSQFIAESCILDISDVRQTSDLEDTVPVENEIKDKLEE